MVVKDTFFNVYFKIKTIHNDNRIINKFFFNNLVSIHSKAHFHLIQ